MLPASLLVVTTIYDELLELAFRKLGKAFDVVFHAPMSQEKLLSWPHGHGSC